MARAEHPRAVPVLPLLDYQREAVESTARFCWYNWSRQVGKSHAGALKRVARGFARNRNQILLSASERQSAELMQKIKLHITALRKKIAANVEYGEGADRLLDGTELKRLEAHVVCKNPKRDFRIIALPANPETVRGYTGDLMFDEFAMHKHDREIWGALFPAVLRGDGEIDVWSTPKGRENMFYSLRDNAQFAHSTVTIFDAIAQGLEADPDVLREALGDEDLWQQEFLCEFVEGAAAFLTYEQIAACEEPNCPREPDEHAPIYLGVDVGRKHDLTVLWELQRVGDVFWTCLLDELRKMPFQAQYDRIAGIMSDRRVKRCCVDATGLGMMLAENLARRFGPRVEEVTFSAPVKQELAGPVRRAFEDRTVRIPASPEIRNDLHSVQKIVTAAGNVRYAAERTEDGHADRFWSLALALHAGAETDAPNVYVGRGEGGEERQIEPESDAARLERCFAGAL